MKVSRGNSNQVNSVVTRRRERQDNGKIFVFYAIDAGFKCKILPSKKNTKLVGGTNSQTNLYKTFLTDLMDHLTSSFDVQESSYKIIKTNNLYAGINHTDKCIRSTY